MSLKSRLLRLERSEIERASASRQPLPGMFEEMHVSEEDFKCLDGVLKRGDAVTPDDRAAIDRFLAEYERAFNVVSQGAT